MDEFNDTDIKIINATFIILQKEGFAKATECWQKLSLFNNCSFFN